MDHREQLIAEVREVARRLGGKNLSRRTFERESGVGKRGFTRHFDSWGELCRAAGVEPYRCRNLISDEEIFAAMRTAFLDLGGVPPLIKFVRRFRYSQNVFTLRGWGWPGAKLRFRAWAEKNDPAFPYLDRLPTEIAKPKRLVPPPPADDAPPAAVHEPKGTRLLGEATMFRALARAPVNELGVVLLFGMVAEELGYVVELVGPGFPDCEAFRRVVGQRWERLRAEFEFRSRNFLLHGHDPKGCDLIVCWEHDWPECPLEALELKTVIAKLARERGA
jgi:hypothetical protein